MICRDGVNARSPSEKCSVEGCQVTARHLLCKERQKTLPKKPKVGRRTQKSFTFLFHLNTQVCLFFNGFAVCACCRGCAFSMKMGCNRDEELSCGDLYRQYSVMEAGWTVFQCSFSACFSLWRKITVSSHICAACVAQALVKLAQQVKPRRSHQKFRQDHKQEENRSLSPKMEAFTKVQENVALCRRLSRVHVVMKRGATHSRRFLKGLID